MIFYARWLLQDYINSEASNGSRSPILCSKFHLEGCEMREFKIQKLKVLRSNDEERGRSFKGEGACEMAAQGCPQPRVPTSVSNLAEAMPSRESSQPVYISQIAMAYLHPKRSRGH